MLKESDEQWLRDNHPGVIPAGEIVSGTIEFSASYNKQNNTFVILDHGATDQAGAVLLSGSFRIQIEDRADKSISRLPALFVHAIDPTPERHVNQLDQSACLCSPFEEDEFLRPELQFRPFLEQLVIPFLYGQVFYASQGHWPWTEYAHGTTGILEAYSRIEGQSRAEECLRRLVQDTNWVRIQSALRQKPYIKGHTLCLCSRMDHMRRCHPLALKGLLRLQRDLKALGIRIP